MKAKTALRPKKGEPGYSEFDYDHGVFGIACQVLVVLGLLVLSAYLFWEILAKICGRPDWSVAESTGPISGTGYFAIVLAIYSGLSFVFYVISHNWVEKTDEDGVSYLADARQDGQPVKYFLADFPDGFGKWFFIIFTMPLFWPVYLVSWLRMQRFKKNACGLEGGVCQ